MSDGVGSSLARVPWSRTALAYAVLLSLVELVAFAASPPLFRALVVADAAVGWTIVFASWQGLRAVPSPPPRRAVLISALATAHWLAALLALLL